VVAEQEEVEDVAEVENEDVEEIDEEEQVEDVDSQEEDSEDEDDEEEEEEEEDVSFVETDPLPKFHGNAVCGKFGCGGCSVAEGCQWCGSTQECVGADLFSTGRYYCPGYGGNKEDSNCKRRKACSIPAAPANGFLRIPKGQIYNPDIAHFSCAHGYAITGSTIVKCRSDGTWSSPAPTCDPVKCPPVFPADCNFNGCLGIHSDIFLSNGQQERVAAANLTFGDTLTVRCKDGFTSKKSRKHTKVTCNARGRFKPALSKAICSHNYNGQL